MLNAAIVCIGKRENLYIREFVEWYKNLGFSKIYLCDNNVDEYFQDVILDYVESEFVMLCDCRNRECCQMESYNEVYERFHMYHDWMLFVDIDEFLVLPNHNNVSEFLSESYFEDAAVIGVNWKIYSDNDLLLYEDKLLNERFTTPCEENLTKNYEFPENDHVKIFVKTFFSEIYFLDPHRINVTHMHTSTGEMIEADFHYPHDFSNAYLKHFITKSIGEYIQNKIKRGYPDWNTIKAQSLLTFDNFFIFNKKNEKKLKIIENYLKYRYIFI